MNKQQEQMNQNPNQEVEYISGFLNEDEEVNESDFDESIGEQESDKLEDNQQNKPEEEEQPKKTKRSKKTIEQEIAELDAKREKLMEKKRRQEAHEKIVFGSVTITMLKEMKKNSYTDYKNICRKLIEIANNYKKYDKQIIEKIIYKLSENI